MTSVFTISTNNDDHIKMYSEVNREMQKHCGVSLSCYTFDHAPSDFGTSGFYDVMTFKVDTILRELNRLDVDHIIYFDSDIAILGDVVSAMIHEVEGNDILLQRDNTNFCAGMFVAKNNNATKTLFESIRIAMNTDREKYEPHAADQTALNALISEIPDLDYGYLSDRFTTFGNLSNHLWDDDIFDLDESVLAFHANFTIGSCNKTKLLNYVRSQHENIRLL